MIKFTSSIRVRYADTDQMKSAYYGKFFEYFEQGFFSPSSKRTPPTRRRQGTTTSFRS